MCYAQKEALFNLAVAALTLGTVLALYPFLGQAALIGTGIMLLWVFGGDPLFYRKDRSQVVADERDQLIRGRSTKIAYGVFWVAFVLCAYLARGFYGIDGAVPVIVVLDAVSLGWILIVAVHAIATLVQYSWGDSDGGG